MSRRAMPNKDWAEHIEDLDVLQSFLPDGWYVYVKEARPGKGRDAYVVYKDGVRYTQKQSSNFANVLFWALGWEAGVLRHFKSTSQSS